MIADNVDLDKKFFGEKTIIMAQSGYGKSYTARVVVEEGIEKGVSFIIIDPQGAYGNLPDFEEIHATDIKKIQEYARLLAFTNRNAVISTKKMTIDEQNNFLAIFLKHYRKYRRRGIQCMIVDEMHKFAPETEKKPAKEELRGMFQEDRSDGQGIIGITQRPARVDKTILAQGNNIAIGRLTARADKEAVAGYIDEKSSIEKIKKLKQGEFFLMGFGFEEPVVVQIRKANTKHTGESPKNLLTEDSSSYNQQAKGLVRKTKMSKDEVVSVGPVKVPSQKKVLDLAGIGAKVALGGAVGGAMVQIFDRYVPVPQLPLISKRTLASAVSTIGMYSVYKAIPDRMNRTEDVLKYAVAGSSVFLLGNLVGDGLRLMGVRLPDFANAILQTATGSPFGGDKKQAVADAGEQPVDLDTAMG
jgi:hypothetical protein